MTRAEVSSPVLAVAFLVGLGALSSGCGDRDTTSAKPCTPSDLVARVRVASVDKVDLLFVIDNSGSMTEEQVSLAQQLPHLIQALASGDQDADGIVDFPPVRSLQVGVVTSDMGTGGFGVPTCSEPNFGDDGVLRRTGNTAIGGCPGIFATSFLTFTPGGSEPPGAFATRVACLAVVGTGGCGFEQPLEATLKAVTSSTQPAVGRFDGTFTMDTTGHADGANGGFVRPDSVLVIIEVTDEEDCSALDPELFNPPSTVYAGDLNLRCFEFPEAVQPVGRYVDGLLASRTRPDRLVYAVIAGVPVNAIPPPGAEVDFDAILAHPDMIEQIDPDMMTRIRPSCNVAGRGLAFPPRRLVEVAKGLHESGAAGIVQSICQPDYTSTFDAIIDEIADALSAGCLPYELSQNEDGTVDCQVFETLPAAGAITHCEQIPGRTLSTTDAATGGEVCEVTQLTAAGGVAPTEPGWYYDDFSVDVLRRCADTETDGQRISYTAGNAPRTGTQVRLDCPRLGEGTVVDSYSPCDAAIDTTTCERGSAPASSPDSRCARDLVCDPETRVWHMPCDTDANCPAAFRCVTDRGTSESSTPLPNICVNPSC